MVLLLGYFLKFIKAEVTEIFKTKAQFQEYAFNWSLKSKDACLPGPILYGRVKMQNLLHVRYSTKISEASYSN